LAVVVAACGGNSSGAPSVQDIVAAVARPGTIFHAVCSVEPRNEPTVVEQWFSPDQRVTRTNTLSNGNLALATLVSDSGILIFDSATRTVRPGDGLMPVPRGASSAAEASLLHLGGILRLDSTKITAVTESGRAMIVVNGTRIRPPEEAGEDEPAGGQQSFAFDLDRVTLLPVSVTYRETRPDGSTIPGVFNNCSTAEELRANQVDASLFDSDAFQRLAAP
jgi:hypothetical protein